MAEKSLEKNAAKPDYGNPAYYTNRELSWIMFNERILDEAKDKTLPLFERVNFLSITASNQDEFFMVRVASLKDQQEAGYSRPDIAGMTPAEQLTAISGELHRFAEQQYRTYRSLIPKLAEAGVEIVTSHEMLEPEDAAFVDRFFQESIYPVLTPMAVDSSRPFPLIRNKTLNIALLLRGKKEDDRKRNDGKTHREAQAVFKDALEPDLVADAVIDARHGDHGAREPVRDAKQDHVEIVLDASGHDRRRGDGNEQDEAVDGDVPQAVGQALHQRRRTGFRELDGRLSAML